jgi:hypothetical protein
MKRSIKAVPSQFSGAIFAHFLLLVVASKSLLSSEVATPHLHGATSVRKLLGDYLLYFVSIHEKQQKNWGKKKSCIFGLK